MSPLVWNGNWGGQSDSKFSGILGSFAEAIGIDCRSTPGLMKIHQKLSRDSGSTVDEFCLNSIACSNGYEFWFSSTSGKIWARSALGVWTLAYTTSAGAGTNGCSGAKEFDGYIYWATQSRLHRIPAASADDAWTSVDLNWATFGVTDANFHPMAIQDLTLFIGDGNQVAMVDELGVFDANVLDLPSPLRIKTMIDYDIDLLIGTFVASTVNQTQIIRWDTVSPSWNTLDPIDEAGINAFIRDDNYVYANAGRSGNLYYYDGQKLLPFKRIPGSYSSTAYGSVNPNSVANFMGTPVFGFSNGLGNPAKQGIYALGSYSRDYPKVLSLDFPVSVGQVSGVEIGAVLVADFDIMVAWKYSAVATMTIADPCVVTLNSHGFTDGTPVAFSTTGTLPTGVTAGTTYYAKSTGVNTFNLYDTAAHAVSGGATGRVISTVTQSGTHTIYLSAVDKIDYSTRYSGAYLETMMLFQGERDSSKTMAAAFAYYNSLPAGCEVTIYYSINGGAYVAMTPVVDTSLNMIESRLSARKIGSLQFKIAFTTSGNNSPTLEALGVDFQ